MWLQDKSPFSYSRCVYAMEDAGWPQAGAEHNERLAVVAVDGAKQKDRPRIQGARHWPDGGRSIECGGPTINTPGGEPQEASSTTARFYAAPLDLHSCSTMPTGIPPGFPVSAREYDMGRGTVRKTCYATWGLQPCSLHRLTWQVFSSGVCYSNSTGLEERGQVKGKERHMPLATTPCHNQGFPSPCVVASPRFLVTDHISLAPRAEHTGGYMPV